MLSQQMLQITVIMSFIVIIAEMQQPCLNLCDSADIDMKRCSAYGLVTSTTTAPSKELHVYETIIT